MIEVWHWPTCTIQSVISEDNRKTGKEEQTARNQANACETCLSFYQLTDM